MTTGRAMIEALLDKELDEADVLQTLAKTYREMADQFERDAASKKRFVELTRRTSPQWSEAKCDDLARRGNLADYIPS